MLKKLKQIEEKVIFNFTRIVSLIIITAIFILLLTGIIILFNIKSNTYVNYSEVRNQLITSDSSVNNNSQTPKETNDLNTIASGIEIPKDIKEVFQGENREVLVNWLRNLDNKQQEEFITNLTTIKNEAENDESINFNDAINTYSELKFNAFSQSANNPYSAYEDIALKIVTGIFIIIGIGLIGLFSLILVLLAIERNTRQKDEMKNLEWLILEQLVAALFLLLK